MKLLLILFALSLTGCVTSDLVALQSNNLAQVVCIKGSGPPLTGQGDVIIINTQQGFLGQIAVGENCQITFDHYLPYKEDVERWVLEQQKKAGMF